MAKRAKKSNADRDDAPSFEEELARLESTVHELEDGQLDLGESLKRYEQGVKHLTRCYQLLERAEQKIELLLNVDADGNEQTERFSEGSASLEEKAAGRSRRRSRPSSVRRDDERGSSPTDVDSPGELF